MTVSLPYVDNTLAELEAGNTDLIDRHGQHMHYGYWADPRRPDITPEGYKKAADELAFQHFDMARIRPGHKILDVGCGFGGSILLLNDNYRNVDVTGLNIDPRQIEWARRTVLPKRRGSNAIAFEVGDACELPYPDASFDTIYAIECVFHFPSRKRFLEQARRVLKPGGRLVVSDFVIYAPTAALVIATEPWYRKDLRRVFGDSAPPWSRTMYQWMARAAGLKVVEFRDVTANTLPTFKALRIWQGSMERASLSDSYARANRYFEWTVRLELLRYQLFALERR